MVESWINLKTLNRALDNVRDELGALGFLTERLETVDTLLVSPLFPERFYGYYLEESPLILGWLGWEAGHIYIPSVRLSILLSLFGYRDYFSLRHVLRHEYGHALAHKHPSLVKRSKNFTQTFGGRYDRESPVGAYNPIDFVSEYAATKPGEDFAETFALYVRSKGDVSRYSHLPGVFSKLYFISELSIKT